MVTGIEKDLLLNFMDFYNSGNDELEKQRYNPAISSYFKALVILCDWKIYKERGLLPKNHNERFDFLKQYFPEAYSLASSIFKEYRDSYNLRMEKKDALKVKENVEKLRSLFEVKEDS
ncbi:MAG: hypothetical protein AABX74_04980 [Nanoarchaeota archaeon]|mgnify:FL=1